ncbi:NAD(P)-dependent alcohol dehydrogenase [Sunxiuqinia sp. A32]|uniref:NAD(P)-dependent alcohol dehydrogenase n=1 Tax=Sunxiuqinia sp. A32 TaxID=3461496 RepID=UPI0040456F2B
MKAIICPKYGSPDLLQIKEVAKPEPKANEVLIKVMATTVNGADARIRGAVFPSIFNIPVRLALGIEGPRKKILGVELSGVIEAIGEKVSRLKVGDEVFASTGASFGAHAEYTCLAEKEVIALKPNNMTFEEAAAVPHCALAALHYLRKGNVKENTKVAIYGAAGGIGSFALQLAKVFGAEVTGVCSTANLELIKSLGADKVVDYTKQHISQTGEMYDVIFDTVGKAPITECVKSLNEGGIYMSAVHLELSRILEGRKSSRKYKRKVVGGVAPYTVENLNYLRELVESGKMKSAIDKQYDFEQIPEAYAYVDKGHKKGHVVITVDHKN